MLQDQIKLKKLEIENFGPFYGDNHFIEFAHESKIRNITLIEGVVGRGKTNIFQLMYWIIYGDEWLHEQGISAEKKELRFLWHPEFEMAINTLTISEEKEFKVGGILILKKIEDGKPKEYRVERYRHYSNSKLSRGSLKRKKDVFRIYKDGEKVTEASEFINKVFNPEVRDFFFIHGESLAGKLQNVKNVKDYSMKLSDYQDIKNLKTALERGRKWADGRLQEEQKHDAQLKRFNENKKKKEDKLEELKNDLVNTNKEIDEANDLIMKKQELRDNLGEENETAQRLAGLYKTREDIQDQVLEEERKRAEALKEHLPFILLEKAFKSCSDDLAKKKSTGVWPTRVTRELVDDVLKMDTCLGIEWNDEIKETVLDFKSILPEDSGEANQILQDFDSKLEREIKNLPKRKKKINEAIVAYDSKIAKLGDINSDISDIEAGFAPKKGELDEYLDLNRRIKEISLEIEEMREKLGKIKEKRDTKIEEIDKQNEEIKKIKATIKGHTSKTKKGYEWEPVKEKVEKMEFIVENIEVEFERSIQNEVQRKTSHLFKAMVPDPETWDRIDVVADGHDGWELISYRKMKGKELEAMNLSGGQSRLFSLSYVVSLNNLLGISIPLVYDSMFVNLSREEQKKVAGYIPPYYKNGQIILFAKDAELKDIDDILLKFIGKCYRLVVDPDRGSLIETKETVY